MDEKRENQKQFIYRTKNRKNGTFFILKPIIFQTKILLFYLYRYTDYYKQANYRQFQTMEFSQIFKKSEKLQAKFSLLLEKQTKIRM